MSIQRIADSLTIRRRLHSIITTPRPTPPPPPAIEWDFTNHNHSPSADCISFLAMCHMVEDGLVTLDRERWN